MKRIVCKKCGKVRVGGKHHINRNQENNSKNNLVNLCLKCHDFIQGECDQCIMQQYCFLVNFIECWKYEDTPIHFKPKPELIEESKKEINEKKVIGKQCIFCSMWFATHKNVNIDFWCDSCLEKLIIKQTPDKWKFLQDWKNKYKQVIEIIKESEST